MALVFLDTETGTRNLSQVIPVHDERYIDKAAGLAYSMGAHGGKTSLAEVYLCRIELGELLRSE